MGRDESTKRSLSDLAKLVQTARREPDRLWSIEYAAEQGRMAAMTWRRVEESQGVRVNTYSGVEAALEWPHGSITTYLDGGPEPQRIERAPSRPNAPTIYEATYEQLRDELDRRYYWAISRQHDAPTPLASVEGEETAESVRARGMIPGRRMRGGTDDAASEGHG